MLLITYLFVVYDFETAYLLEKNIFIGKFSHSLLNYFVQICVLMNLVTNKTTIDFDEMNHYFVCLNSNSYEINFKLKGNFYFDILIKNHLLIFV